MQNTQETQETQNAQETVTNLVLAKSFIRYGVVDADGDLISQLYTRKGDAVRFRKSYWRALWPYRVVEFAVVAQTIFDESTNEN